MGKSSSCPSTHPTLTNAPPPLRESKILADSEAATVPSLIWKELCQTSALAALFLAVACWDLDCGCKPAGSSKRRGGGFGGSILEPGLTTHRSVRARIMNPKMIRRSVCPCSHIFFFFASLKKKKKKKECTSPEWYRMVWWHSAGAAPFICRGGLVLGFMRRESCLSLRLIGLIQKQGCSYRGKWGRGSLIIPPPPIHIYSYWG